MFLRIGDKSDILLIRTLCISRWDCTWSSLDRRFISSVLKLPGYTPGQLQFQPGGGEKHKHGQQASIPSSSSSLSSSSTHESNPLSNNFPRPASLYPPSPSPCQSCKWKENVPPSPTFL